MNNVTIFGYHGMGNFGDDFFLDYILNYCKRIDKKECFVSARKGTLSKKLINDNVLSVKEILPKKRLFKGYDKWFLLLFYALKSDVLFFCAGSIFTILPERLFFVIIKTLKIFKPDLKIIAVGVSIGPFKDKRAERFIIRALNLFDVIMVRDQKSITYDLEANTQFLNDLAFTHAPTKNLRKNIIGVALNPYISMLNSNELASEYKRNERISKAIASSFEKYNGVKLFVTCNDSLYGDWDLAEDLQKRLFEKGVSSEIVSYSGEIDDFSVNLSGVKKLIASRLHTGFFGLLNGAEVFQLKYAEKIEEFYRGLDLENISFNHAYDFPCESLELFLSTNEDRYDSDFHVLSSLSQSIRNDYEVALDKVSK